MAHEQNQKLLAALNNCAAESNYLLRRIGHCRSCAEACGLIY